MIEFVPELMTKRTPSPWVWELSGGLGYVNVWRLNGPRLWCEIPVEPPFNERTAADADLIAAAPDMGDALIESRRALEMGLEYLFELDDEKSKNLYKIFSRANVKVGYAICKARGDELEKESWRGMRV